MSVMDIMNFDLERRTHTHRCSDEVASQVPAATLGSGLGEAFRFDRTPAFGDMASSLFGQSNPEQNAGLLAQLDSAVGPTSLSTIAGGALGRFMQGRSTAAAQQSDPSVLDGAGSYYAQHPQIVKAPGGAALAIALGQIAQRMKT